MRRKLNRLIAGILFAVIFAGGFSGTTVYSANGGEISKDDETSMEFEENRDIQAVESDEKNDEELNTSEEKRPSAESQDEGNTENKITAHKTVRPSVN